MLFSIRIKRTFKKVFIRIILFIFLIFSNLIFCQEDHHWSAKWIVAEHAQDIKNSWIIATNTVKIDPFKKAGIRIAVDSKYWLWINKELVVFEGGLKRGPTRNDTYYDEINVDQYLKEGENTITVLYWYFGKSGFSHISSGKAGFLFELFTDSELRLISDKSWFMHLHPAYRNSSKGPQPNYRLPESNVVYDARNEVEGWPEFDQQQFDYNDVMEIGQAGCAPWNHLVKRPIPLWKDFGLKSYPQQITFPFVSGGDTIRCKLPYNAQFTPCFKIEAESGLRINLLTDNYKGGGVTNLRGVYYTKKGVQEYESRGWINGHYMYYIIPKGIKVLDLKYRETGYDTEFSGSFSCNDEKLNKLWKKAQRTLYITMRDTYMDCPDRERAQWWGDEVLELEESFYALDTRSHLLAKKGILELMNWQRSDHTISSPIPGTFRKELPMQMLASVGYYGFRNYLMHSGDTATIKSVLPGVKKYLSLWNIKTNGLVKERKGGWTWGDWGKNKDMSILYNTWFYLACKGYASMAEILGKENEKNWALHQMKIIRQNFNDAFWKEDQYRSDRYKRKTDDRANAMAVLADMAKPEYYPHILQVLKEQEHASPYMEKYVIEALFKMGYDDYALERLKKRFTPMTDSELTTLWEGWGIGSEGYGGGTYNHGWSGGGLSLLSKYVAGISPLSPGYDSVEIRPVMGSLKYANAEINTVKGNIKVFNTFKDEHTFVQEIFTPENIGLHLIFPKKTDQITSVLINNAELEQDLLRQVQKGEALILKGGTYQLIVKFE